MTGKPVTGLVFADELRIARPGSDCQGAPTGHDAIIETLLCSLGTATKLVVSVVWKITALRWFFLKSYRQEGDGFSLQGGTAFSEHTGFKSTISATRILFAKRAEKRR
jgi:hypothetical protein